MSHGHLPSLVPSLSDFIPETLRGTEGFFRVGKTRHGTWWLIDPFGQGFFAKSVSGVNRTGKIGSRLPCASTYAANIVGGRGVDGPTFMRHAVGRLRAWHFNALGAWAEPGEGGHGMYFTEVLDFKRTGPCIHFLDMHLPDVFDPDWVLAVEARAKGLCAPLLANRELIGYFTDDGLGWAQPDEAGPTARFGRPTLLQLCLSLEPTHRAYHAAWEFVLAPHRGDVESLGRAWSLKLANRESIRQITSHEVAITHPGYRADCVSFTREYARRYHAIASRAIRNQDPHHLVLGSRNAVYPGNGVAVETGYPHFDVVSCGGHGKDWAGAVETMTSGRETPVWFVNADWAGPEFLGHGLDHRGPTPLERMLKEGRHALKHLIEHPCVVGYEWLAWADAETDIPPFGRGLVHSDDHEGREHTDLLTQLNQKAELTHGKRASLAEAEV